jgi:hypothetical protein
MKLIKLKIECDFQDVHGTMLCPVSDASDAFISLGRDHAHWAAAFVTAGMALLGEAGGGKPTQQQVKALLRVREEAEKTNQE